jgi:nicotinamidase-related amidase
MTQAGRHPNMLDVSDTVLLVIDVQERFRSVQKEFDTMAAGCIKLIKTFRALDLPIIVTEQYPKGLGQTIGEIRELLGSIEPLTKTVFSSYGCAGVPEQLESAKARKVLVCGIETHVCVNQTVHDLLAAGYRVHVAVDAVESRHAVDRELALRRMEAAGAILTTTEAAAFELMVDAKHEKFREVQAFYI